MLTVKNSRHGIVVSKTIKVYHTRMTFGKRYDLCIREYEFPGRIARVFEKRETYMTKKGEERVGRCKGLNVNDIIIMTENLEEIKKILSETPNIDFESY